jgi:hypothetical protein
MGVAESATGNRVDTGEAVVPDAVIPNINSKDSFNRATARPNEVAGLYFYLKLDCLVDYAYRVAVDFFRRPELYRDLGEPSINAKLARLGARYGSNERIPSQEQRDAIYLPIFGESSTYLTDGQSQFSRGRDGLVDAAAAFAERVFDDGVEMLRARVRTFHHTFKAWLIRLEGHSLQWSKEQALAGVTENLAYSILRNSGVAAVFGISSPPSELWPYTEDPNGDMLIEEISKQLVVATNSHTAITREGISNRQRTALRGAEALATIITFDEGNSTDADLNLLITRCYTWGSALKSLPS